MDSETTRSNASVCSQRVRSLAGSPVFEIRALIITLVSTTTFMRSVQHEPLPLPQAQKNADLSPEKADALALEAVEAVRAAQNEPLPLPQAQARLLFRTKDQHCSALAQARRKTLLVFSSTGYRPSWRSEEHTSE